MITANEARERTKRARMRKVPPDVLQMSETIARRADEGKYEATFVFVANSVGLPIKIVALRERGFNVVLKPRGRGTIADLVISWKE